MIFWIRKNRVFAGVYSHRRWGIHTSTCLYTDKYMLSCPGPSPECNKGTHEEVNRYKPKCSRKEFFNHIKRNRHFSVTS